MKTLWCIAGGSLLAVATSIPLGEAMYHQRSQLDPELGWVKAVGGKVVWRMEGNGISTWGPHGVRNTGNSKTNSGARILVLGDSLTESLQVDDDVVYTAQLEKRLRQSGCELTVMNAGASGLSMADYIWRARVYKKLFKVSWFVVQVTPEDFVDYSDVTPELCQLRWASAAKTLEIIPPTFGTCRSEKLLAHLPKNLGTYVSFAYAFKRTAEFRSWLRNEPPWFHAAAPKQTNTSPAGEEYPMPLKLDLLKEACDGRLTLFLLASFYPGASNTLSRAEQKIVDVCWAKGIACVSLGQGFGAFSGSGCSPYGFDNLGGYNRGHLNAEGHRMAAIVLGQELERRFAQHDLQ